MDSAFFSKKSKNIQLSRIEDYEKNHAIHKTMLPYFFFFHWNLLSPSVVRETNLEPLERNGDQTIFSGVALF